MSSQQQQQETTSSINCQFIVLEYKIQCTYDDDGNIF